MTHLSRACPAHLDLTALKCRIWWKSTNFSLRNAITSSVRGPNIPVTTLISKLAQSMYSSLWGVFRRANCYGNVCNCVADYDWRRWTMQVADNWALFLAAFPRDRLVADSSRTGEKIQQSSGYRPVITLELQLIWSGTCASLPLYITLGLICIEREIYSFFLNVIYIHYGTCKILNIRAEIKVFMLSPSLRYGRSTL